MRRGNRYNNVKKERTIMIASAAFVLAALTMTGVYVKFNSEQEKDDGYHIDFSTLENQAEIENENPDGISDELVMLEEPLQDDLISDDALDYFPPLAEADSGGVKIPGLTLFEENPELAEGAEEEVNDVESDILADEAAMAADAKRELEEAANARAEAADEELTLQQEAAAATENQVVQPQVTYSILAGGNLVWPINGNVLINYSMDATVYFATLQQYKYNPGIVVGATEGDTITANASGVVTEVFYDEELGNGVKVDIGRGYTAIYGQLKDVQVQKGSVVVVGNILGYVAAPTKYYSVEGTNAYFALEKDGAPVDPFGTLE